MPPSRLFVDICAKIQNGVLSLPLDELELFEVRHRARVIGLLPIIPSGFQEVRVWQNGAILKRIEIYESANAEDKAELRQEIGDKINRWFQRGKIEIERLTDGCIKMGLIPEGYNFELLTPAQIAQIKILLYEHIMGNITARKRFLDLYCGATSFSSEEKEEESKTPVKLAYLDPKNWYPDFIRKKYLRLLAKINRTTLLTFAVTNGIETEDDPSDELLIERIYDFLLAAGGG